jgi:hypothetical protein
MGSPGKPGTSRTFPADVKARNDKMVELVDTMLNPSTGLRAWLHKDLPKAKTPHVWAHGLRLTAYGPGEDEIRIVEGG